MELEKEEQEEVVDPQQVAAEESRARLSGWTPQTEFKGNAEKWTDATKWNQRADELMPIIRANNKRLETDLGATKTELAQLKKTMAQIITANEGVAARERAAALEIVRKEQIVAISQGDGDKWAELEEKKDDLTKSRPPIVVPENTLDVTNQNYNIFMQRNAGWYGNDAEMTGFAVYLGKQLADGGMAEHEQFPEIERQIKEKFAHKFGNQRTTEQAVDTGTGTPVPPGKNGKETYAAMPADAKAACDSAVNSISNQYPNRDVKVIRSGWVKEFYSEA